MIKLLKKIIFYDEIIKFKSFLISHIAIWSLFVCEICIFILTFFETISEQIDLKNKIALDYILGFKTYFLLNNLIFYMLFGFFTIVLFILFYILKTIFKKNLIIKKGFLTDNYIYHKIWPIGMYITLIISFCVFIYLLTISYEGVKWLVDK